MKRANLLILLMVVVFAWIVPAPAHSDIDPQQWYVRNTLDNDHAPDIDEDSRKEIHNVIGTSVYDRFWITYNNGLSIPKEFGPLRMASSESIWPRDNGFIFMFRKDPANPPGPVTFGENVAIFLNYRPGTVNAARGWLYFSQRTQKVQLSFGPRYEWALTGGPTGTIIKPYNIASTPRPPYDIVGIYNAVVQDHVIYCEQNSTGLGWARDCD